MKHGNAYILGLSEKSGPHEVSDGVCFHRQSMLKNGGGVGLRDRAVARQHSTRLAPVRQEPSSSKAKERGGEQCLYTLA